jgi:hypothetical protein
MAEGAYRYCPTCQKTLLQIRFSGLKDCPQCGARMRRIKEPGDNAHQEQVGALSKPAAQVGGAVESAQVPSGNPVSIKPHDVARFQRECVLLRANLDAICLGVDLSDQRGLAVDMGTGQVTSAAASREVFRQLVSVHLANIEDAAQRAAQAGGEVVTW